MTKLTILHTNNCFLSFFFTLASNKKRTFHSFFSFPHPFALQLSPIFTHFNIHKTIDFLCDCLFIFKAANISTNFIFNSSEKKNSVFFRRSFSFCYLFRNKMKCDVGNIVTIYSNAIFWPLFIHIYTN